MHGSSIAVVFPGQGSQRGGMGRDFYENIPSSRDTYREASDILGWDVAALCFGEDERLNLTEYAQPCILATEIAMLRGIRALYGFTAGYFGGHSLGEYTALVASDTFPFPEALEIVRHRGRLMQEATPVGTGGMAAVIADNLDAEMLQRQLDDLSIDVANDNSASQVVISGPLSAMTEAEERIRACVGDGQSFRFVPLNVSAPFHSRFMNTVGKPFQKILSGIQEKLHPAGAERVTSNVTGLFHSKDPGKIVARLVSQLSSTVRWKKNMEALGTRADAIIEIGPGRPLKAFFKTMNLECHSVTTFSAARRLFDRGGAIQNRTADGE